MIRLTLAILLLLATINIYAQDENLSDNEITLYIKKYNALAIAEQKRTGVPAAITLAQGIHESASGRSELATQAFNHFGIKCKNTWTGETFLHDDDRKQECFRKYMTAEQSYIDHSDFLKNNKRYEKLFLLEVTDYNGWAVGLKKAGYATNPVYVKRLTGLVEKYNLNEFTYIALGKKPGEVVPEKDNSLQNTQPQDPSKYYKGTKGFWASKGDMLLEKAVENKVRYAKLLAMNDLKDEPLKQDMFIFLERKRSKGSEEFHIVKEDETIALISQREAMTMDALYEFNNIIVGQEPLAGEKLYLQYRNSSIPSLQKQVFNLQKEIPVEKIITETPIIKNIKSDFPIVADNTKPIETIVTSNKVESNPLEISKDIILETAPENVKEITKEIAKEETPFIINLPTDSKANENILDIAKANKIEQLLNGNKVYSEPMVDTVVNTTEPLIINTATSTPLPIKEVVRDNPFDNTIVVSKVDTAPVVQEVKKIERTYNEEGVSDSLKDLKKRFDLLIYQEKRKIEPKKIEKKMEKKVDVIKDTTKITKTIKKEIAKEKPIKEIKKTATLKDTITSKKAVVVEKIKKGKLETANKKTIVKKEITKEDRNTKRKETLVNTKKPEKEVEKKVLSSTKKAKELKQEIVKKIAQKIEKDDVKKSKQAAIKTEKKSEKTPEKKKSKK
jgi:uncharacterized FlgJ-related protein